MNSGLKQNPKEHQHLSSIAEEKEPMKKIFRKGTMKEITGESREHNVTDD